MELNLKIILMHVGALITINVFTFAKVKFLPSGQYEDLFFQVFACLGFLLFDLVFVIVKSYSSKREDMTKFEHWIGFGLAVLLTYPVCMGLSDLTRLL
ncbi:MAG: hypothetical protein FD163_2418 [Hyphomonadaceae bacterium]|nr:MAG: hypothetical protein FD163_2418 [Hyphomonadaceae bacterium]